jgi:hypothetical protein
MKGTSLAIVAGWTAMILAVGAIGQTPSRPDDPMARPSEYSLRLTPGIARGMAGVFVKEALVRELEMDKSRQDEFTDLIARRIMSAAHAVDTEEGQATGERMAATLLDAFVNGDHRPEFTPEQAKVFGRDMMSVMPHVRKLVREVAQDVRPALGLKQQLKFAGELMAVNAAMDGFEGAMTRWSKGELVPGEDPFDPAPTDVPLDEQGASNDLKQARESARNDGEVKRSVSEWETYVKEAKAFYGFDQAQSATADSVLREIKLRGEELTRSPEFKQRRQLYAMWGQLVWSLGSEYRGDEGPFVHMLNRANLSDQRAINSLTDELRQRIERIPRQEQHRSADRRIEEEFARLIPASAPAPGGSADAK